MNNQNLNYNLTLKDLFDKTMGKAISSTNKLDGKFDSLSNKSNKLSSGVGKLGGVIAGAFAIGGVVAFGNAIKDSLVNYEYFSAALKTLLKGDEYQAKALQSQLVSLARTTPFSLNEVQDATKQLLAYGFQAGAVVDTMRTLGDVSAGIGQPIGDIAYLYGTLKTSGRVTLMDLRQFAGRGIPIYEALSKRLKITTKDVNKLVHDGKLGFKDIEGAFKDMTSEGGQFFNMMDAQSKTVGGRLSNLGDAWEQLKVNIGKSQTGILSSTITWVSSMVDKLNQKLSAGNFLDEALSKVNQLNQYNGLDRFYANIGMKSLSGNLIEMQDYAAYGQSLVSTSKNKKQLNFNEKLVNQDFEKLNKGRKDGSINDVDYNTKAAILSETLNQLQGLRRLFNAKPNETGADAEGKGGKATDTNIGTGIEASVSRPQDLHINIERLVENLSVHSENITEGAGKIKDLVSQYLLEAVNDINYIPKQ